MEYLDQILKLCDVVHEAAADLSPEDFALLRKQGLGASDVSVYLGTMSTFGKTVDSLITDKLTLKYTDADREIRQKPSVRMGVDLEEMVLAKAAAAMGREVIKCKEMFRLKSFPYLTMNLDGITYWDEKQIYIPIEAKVVTTFGDKYYNWDKGLKTVQGFPEKTELVTPSIPRALAKEHIETQAERCGIPPYYYVQVQHEMLGMHAPIAFLAALRVKDWTVYMFPIEEDPQVQQAIILGGNEVWLRIEKLRSMSQH